MKNIFFKRFLYLSLFFLFLCPFILSFGSPPDPAPSNKHIGSFWAGWRITPSLLKSIFLDEEETICVDIKSNKEYFIPTRTEREWDNLKRVALSLGIDINMCESTIREESREFAEERGITDTKILSALSQGDSLELNSYELAIYESARYYIQNFESYLEYQEIFSPLSVEISDLSRYEHSTPSQLTEEQFIDLITDYQGKIVLSSDEALMNLILNSDTNEYINQYFYEIGQEYNDESYLRIKPLLEDYILSEYIERKLEFLPGEIQYWSETLLEAKIALSQCESDPNCNKDDPNAPPWGQGGHTCFTEDTLIKTSQGDKLIPDLKEGDYVLSYNPKDNSFLNSKIDKLLVHKESTNWYYLIKTKNSQVNVTSIHRFYVGNDTYKMISDLQIGDMIYIKLNNQIIKEPILSKEIINLTRPITVYNLELELDSLHNYFANQYLVHNMK